MKFFLRFLRRSGLLHRQFVKRLHSGQLLLVIPNEHIQRQIFWYGFYEREAILTLEKLLSPETTFIDIGANIGYYSIVSSRLVSQVYAFEPAQQSILSLQQNIDLNHIDNITVLPYAVASVSGKKTLHLSEDSNTGMNSLLPPENDSGKSETVTTIVFDEWYRQSGVSGPLCIKIDAEGAEMEIIQGMEQTITTVRPLFFIEIQAQHLRRFGHTPADIFAYFGKHDYSAYQVIEPGILEEMPVPADTDSAVFLPPGYILPAGITIVTAKR